MECVRNLCVQKFVLEKPRVMKIICSLGVVFENILKMFNTIFIVHG